MSENKENYKVISRLKSALADRKKTIRSLSAETGISYSQLSKWINNEVDMSLTNIAIICSVLEIEDISEILKIVKTDNSQEKKTLISLIAS